VRDAPAALDMIAEALAFVVPGDSTGLLDVNSAASDLEGLIATLSPGVWAGSVSALRQLIDAVMDGGAVFTVDAIAGLEEWHASTIDLISALEAGDSPPVPPEAWTSRANRNESSAHVQAGASEEMADPDEAVMSDGTAEITLDLAADEELIAEFHSESLDLLVDIEQGVLKLEENPSESGTIDTIFRAFHTFKGGASILRMEPVAAVAHELETLLDAIRKKRLVINKAIIDVILEGADFLTSTTSAIGERLQGDRTDLTIVVHTASIIDRAKRAVSGELADAAASSLPEVPAAGEPVDEPDAMAMVVWASEEHLPVVNPAAGSKVVVVPAPEAPKASLDFVGNLRQEETGDRRDFQIRSTVGSVKVDTEKLDNLVNLVGELIIAQSMVVEDPAVVGLTSLGLSRSLRELGRVTGELQRNAMSLRMVPVGSVFQKMVRLVRDLGHSTHKSVQLILEGEEVELDRNIVDKIGDPLIHIIRNAVDHGIELPTERVASGKPETGTVRLSATHRRGGICIRIEDDGAGLDAGRILAKAVDLGFVPADANLTENEVFNLIFLAGMSTAAVVTDLSGRGVGMDVVRENIETLRGKIEIESSPGVGTVFTILLPLTLAIIDGLLIGAGDDRYIIPTLSVREAFKLVSDMLSSVHGRSEMIRVRGQQVPLVRLNRCLGIEEHSETSADGIVVVLESGEATRAVLVDQLYGKQEVVIKSIGKIFERQVLVSGGAILSDGRVGLMLDVEKLIKMNF